MKGKERRKLFSIKNCVDSAMKELNERETTTVEIFNFQPEEDEERPKGKGKNGKEKKVSGHFKDKIKGIIKRKT